MKKEKPSEKEKILISVVIPAYNEQKYISVCLEALKKQTFPARNHEIIVVNNGSTDKTGLLAGKMKAKVLSEPEKGLISALKKGFGQTKGQIIAVTDADTVVPHDWLEKISRAFVQKPSLMILSGRIIFKPRNFLIIAAELGQNFFSLLSHSGFGCNLAFKKELYRKISFPQNNLCWETDLIVKAKKYGQTAFLWHNPVVTSSRHYRGREGFKYAFRAATNGLAIFFFKKTIFTDFSDIRD